jgi:hypothetical protein
MNVAVDRPTRHASSNAAPLGDGTDLPLVRAARRKRRAERAFEEYVREMTRRWQLAPDHEGSGADGGPLPRM